MSARLELDPTSLMCCSLLGACLWCLVKMVFYMIPMVVLLFMTLGSSVAMHPDVDTVVISVATSLLWSVCYITRWLSFWLVLFREPDYQVDTVAWKWRRLIAHHGAFHAWERIYVYGVPAVTYAILFLLHFVGEERLCSREKFIHNSRVAGAIVATLIVGSAIGINLFVFMTQLVVERVEVPARTMSPARLRRQRRVA